ncbi:galectin [Plakobranchus ocellatus]|uniref:Galectin n=1 Tax=Plakobranchus ocellatus TaxID=259542 RepID=A0AAV4APT3_9GAST|nr:galectin [Plakobranchus ocellatus]
MQYRRMYLLYNLLVLLATFSVIWATCDVTPHNFRRWRGSVKGGDCQTLGTPGLTYLLCVEKCSKTPDCKALTHACNLLACLCIYCNYVEDLLFSDNAVTFIYMKDKLLAQNMDSSNRVSLPLNEGLSVGQVIRAMLRLGSEFTGFLLVTSQEDFALLIGFRVSFGEIVRNSKIGGQWGDEEFNIPHFNFTAGQEVEIICIVQDRGYLVYIDTVQFFDFRHRYSDLSSIAYVWVEGIVVSVSV